MATSASNWKPVSRRITKFDGGSMTRINTRPWRHDYKIDLDKSDGKRRFVTLRGFPNFRTYNQITLGSRGWPKIHKTDKMLMSVTLNGPESFHTRDEDYGSRKDFGKVGMGVSRNILNSIKKLYPHLRAIAGQRIHKEGNPIESFKVR